MGPFQDPNSHFKSLKLSKSAICPEAPETVSDDTVEMLEDLLNAALTEADNKATAVMEDKTKSLAKGMGLPNIPGLF